MVYFLICVFFAIGAIALAAYIFSMMTKKIDEMNELKKVIVTPKPLFLLV